ncbi:MAG: hypothetical protein HY863_17370 [Chloroflexi bacterium]|nr:hypothetical protein [Chloroflexota bacterium]
MKKNIIIYPILFSLYPIIGLYSRNLTEILPSEIIRPVMIALIFTYALLILLERFIKDRDRAAFIIGFSVFFFSASEISYRVIEGTFFKGLDEAYHRVLLLFAVITIVILGNRGVWEKHMNPARKKYTAEYLNYVSIIMVLLPLINIGKFWYAAMDDAPQPWSSYIAQGESPQSLSSPNPPDIYYIILDGYGRADVLQTIYNHDNSPFTNALTERGFYVGNESQSNYLRTSLSVTSALNMEYINFTTDLAGPKSINRIPLFELAGNNRARRLLESAGYKFVLVDSGSAFTRFYDADYFLSPFKTHPNLFEMWFYSTTALNVLYEPELPFTKSLQDIFPVAGYSVHRRFITGALENLSYVPNIPGPKFVFAHLIVPHPPFVLGGNGAPIRPSYPYVTGDGASFVSNSQLYIDGYTGQVDYINKQILGVIDSILEKSKTPPVIVIQGDHGPGYLLLQQGDTPDSCLWERASILNAYYFPEGKNGLLYESISPINTFRIIFNTYLNGNFELLDDKTYYSLFDVPYDFIDITRSVRNKCGIN